MDILSFLMGRITADGSGGGGGAEPVLIDKTISANGVYNASDDNADGYKKVTAQVPNSYSASDEGKVVSSGALVAQTTGYITENGTFTTTTNNEVVVNVPNSYATADEGKVVSSGALVSQTSRNITENGTYDTTTNDEVVVNVPSSGGNIDALVARTITSYESDTTVVGAYSFRECTALESVTLSGRVHIYSNAFYGCTALRSIKAKNCYKIYGNAFHSVPADALVFPNISNGELGSNAFETWKGTKADLDGSSLEIKLGLFTSASNFNTLILRKNTIVTLASTNAFSGSPFANGGSGGDIYIPKALYDALGTGTNDYKAASNWSTVDGYGTITWHAIEGSYYETHYADGTLIP